MAPFSLRRLAGLATALCSMVEIKKESPSLIRPLRAVFIAVVALSVNIIFSLESILKSFARASLAEKIISLAQ